MNCVLSTLMLSLNGRRAKMLNFKITDKVNKITNSYFKTFLLNIILGMVLPALLIFLLVTLANPYSTISINVRLILLYLTLFFISISILFGIFATILLTINKRTFTSILFCLPLLPVLYYLVQIVPTGLFQEPYKSSFSGETMVLTSEGPKRVSDIQAGEVVVSYDENEDQVVNTEVNSVSSRKATDIYLINNSLEGTSKHKMATLDRKHSLNSKLRWERIENLKQGDSLININKQAVTIKTLEMRSEEKYVYNLHLKYPNTYYVQMNDTWILVHNLKAVTPF